MEILLAGLQPTTRCDGDESSVVVRKKLVLGTGSISSDREIVSLCCAETR